MKKNIYKEPSISVIMLPELMQTTTLPIGSSQSGSGMDPSVAEGKENSDVVDDDDDDPKVETSIQTENAWNE